MYSYKCMHVCRCIYIIYYIHTGIYYILYIHLCMRVCVRVCILMQKSNCVIILRRSFIVQSPPKKHRIHIHNNITNAWIECFKFPGSGLLHTEKAVTTDYKVTPFEK